MKKIPCESQNIEAKNLPADACVFDHFGRLSPAAVHSADCRFDSGVIVLDPCFIHCHIFTQKLLFVALKLLQTTVWIVEASLFLIDCEQTQYPFWKQLSHWQMFMQTGKYIAFWYLWVLCYLTQDQFTIGQNEFVAFFFFVFSGITVEHHLCRNDSV